MTDAHAFILAGGAGTRLWPLSRRTRPKQLLRIFDGKSLLQHAVDRLDGLFAKERIHIVTTADLIDPIAAELPSLPRENLISEPALRDTANAVGLAAHLLAQQSPDAVMCVFTADHLITPRDRFHAAVQRAIEAARSNAGALVTFGIKPTSPHTGYGYVHVGQPAGDGVFESRGFREKPDAATAESYLVSGDYLWNSGMFIWRVDAILAEFGKNLPENDASLRAIAADWGAQAKAAGLAERYTTLPRISIDFGVMERAERVLIVPMDCDWIDVGSWEAIAALHEPDGDGNIAISAQSIGIDATKNTIVSDSDHLIVTLGVENLVVVHTGDVTLICPRDQGQRVREAVERCRTEHGDDYL